jgi:hypothetical protein
MLSRLGAVLIVMTAGMYVWADQTGFAFRQPLDTAVKAELRTLATPDALTRKIDRAIARDDAGEADMYLNLASFAGLPAPLASTEKLKDLLTPEARLQRTATDFAGAIVTGEGSSDAALVSVMSAEASTAGDIRDITLEGGKLASGASYDQVILGLSLAGLKVSKDPAHAHLAKAAGLWKIAHRSKRLQPALSAALIQAVNDAAPIDAMKGELASAGVADLAAAEVALAPLSQRVNLAPLKPLLENAAILIDKAGDAEAVRLAGLAETPHALAGLTELSVRLGKITRGVAEVTGARQISDFETATSVTDAIFLNPVAWGAWAAVCLALLLLGDFKLFGAAPKSRLPQRTMFHRKPLRVLHRMDGTPDESDGH